MNQSFPPELRFCCHSVTARIKPGITKRRACVSNRSLRMNHSCNYMWGHTHLDAVELEMHAHAHTCHSLIPFEMIKDGGSPHTHTHTCGLTISFCLFIYCLLSFFLLLLLLVSTLLDDSVNFLTAGLIEEYRTTS